MKNLYYGFLHVIVALTSILFVCGVTGFNIPLAFLTIGIGTIVFHLITKNKLAVLMGVSGSYVGGLAIVSSTYGVEYAAGGVVLAGIMYVVVGLLAMKYPKVLSAFPMYILNMAVLLIALNLMPIGGSMVAGHFVVATVTVFAAMTAFVSKRFNAFAMPIGLVVGTIAAFLVEGASFTSGTIEAISFTMPAFNLASLTLIGVVALAIVFESMGDIMNCANAQGIKIDEQDIAKGVVGNGVASVISGSLGGLPLTSYSENVGFILMSGWKNPNAQICAAVIFIVMAFVPGIAGLFTIIPGYVFGALLVFLFALIGGNAIKNISADSDGNVVLAMLVTFFIVPAELFSPIGAAIIVGALLHFLTNRK